MTRLIPSLEFLCMAVAFLLLPRYNAGGHPVSGYTFPNAIFTPATKNEAIAESDRIYDSLTLDELGLNKEAFRCAYRGYKNLLKKGWVKKTHVMTICDFSQSSRKKRLYLLDLDKYKVLLQTYVAHGRNSGKEFAEKFSNTPNSRQSSLGFYITKNTYYGVHGLTLLLAGVEKNINDNAERRRIVFHGSEYVGDEYLRSNKFMGRSLGCPAVAGPVAEKIINEIKNGSCLFIYSPDKKYLTDSKILNG